eukprot:COSAG06_NODE_2889_length_6128_cov_12.062521_3_plen_173_part_00
MLRRLGRQTLRKQNYRHLSCEYMGQVSSHVPSCAPLSLLAADQSLLQDIPLQDNNQELLIWAGCLPEQGVITPKMRGVAETNKMLRAQELEDLRPKFELTEKDKDKEEELAKKDKEEEEKLKENETEKLIAAIDKDSAEVKPEYKRGLRFGLPDHQTKGWSSTGLANLVRAV